jgi:hypothetical protein
MTEHACHHVGRVAAATNIKISGQKINHAGCYGIASGLAVSSSAGVNESLTSLCASKVQSTRSLPYRPSSLREWPAMAETKPMLPVRLGAKALLLAFGLAVLTRHKAGAKPVEFVDTPWALQNAVQAGTQHIVINKHLDLRGLRPDPASEVGALFRLQRQTQSVRVRPCTILQWSRVLPAAAGPVFRPQFGGVGGG